MALAGDHVQVLVGGYELTGDSNRIVINDKRTLHDATTFGDAVHRFIPGQRQVSLEHAGWLNAATAQSHPVLRTNDIEGGILSVLLGQNTAPAVGDPAYSLAVTQGKYASLIEVAKVIPFMAQFASRGTQDGWGRALAAPVSFTNSTNGSAVDDGASSSAGGAAYLHVLQAAATDTYAFTVEAADDAGFTTNLATVAAFTLNGAALGSQRIGISGLIRRYARFKAVRTGSAGNTVRIAVNLVRF